MALCTAAEVRAYANLGTSDDDTLIDSIVARTDSAFARWCRFPRTDAGGYTMEATTYTLFVDAERLQDPEHPARLFLPLRPVASVASVHVDPERAYGASTEVDSGDFDIETEDGALVLTDDAGESWSSATRANKIVASCGWGTVPDDLAEAAIIQASHTFRSRMTAGDRTRSTGQNSRTVDRLWLLEEVRKRLAPYQVVSV